MFENSFNHGNVCNTVLVLVSHFYMKCFVVPLQIPCVLLCRFWISCSVSWLSPVAVLVGSPQLQCLLPSCSVRSPQLQCWLAPQGDQFTAVASPLTSSTSCSTAARKKKAIDHRNPRRQKYITFNQRKYGDRGYRNKSILWVPTGNWPIVRRFHFTASFRIIIRPTINTIPT